VFARSSCGLCHIHDDKLVVGLDSHPSPRTEPFRKWSCLESVLSLSRSWMTPLPVQMRAHGRELGGPQYAARSAMSQEVQYFLCMRMSPAEQTAP